ncbi:MAG: hypothetical protein ACU85V_18090 [Gammaproteobacteria bacterium]
MTAELLQSELLAFADRYLEGISEAADWGADHAPDTKSRAAFRQIKVVYVSAAVTTVTEPNPLRVLRDLLVMVRLQRLVWTGGGFDGWVDPEAKARMVDALQRLDRQMTLLAGRVLPAASIDLIHELTADWRARHPDRRYVAFTRFTDLGDTDQRLRLERDIDGGGLLAPIAEASAELHEVRLVAERAVFLVNHMPLLLEWQAEALLYETLDLPEIRGVFADMDRYAKTAEDLVAIADGLPARFGAERAAALTQFATVVARERETSFEQFAGLLGAERKALLEAINDSSAELLPLAEQLARTAEGSRETLRLVAGLRGEEGGDEFSLAEAQALVETTARLTGETQALVLAIGELVGAEATGSRLAQIDGMLARHERRLFAYAAALIVLTAVVCAGAAALVARTRHGRPAA